MKTIVERIKHLGPEFESEADDLEAFLLSRAEKRFTIANAGTTNTGKSSLFNALLGQDGAFKTADIRETVVCRDQNWGPQIVLVDTPGCGSTTEEDDREAYKAYVRADLVLFVHNLASGDLREGEIAVLKSVRHAMGEDDFRSRTLVVGTRLDNCTSQEACVNQEACEKQIKTNLGIDLPWVVVSAKRHLRAFELLHAGETEKATVLQAASGVDHLINAIKKMKNELGKRGIHRFDSLKMKLHNLLKKARQEQAAAEIEVSQAQARLSADMEPYQKTIQALKSA